jgi:hypothetical protein
LFIRLKLDGILCLLLINICSLYEFSITFLSWEISLHLETTVQPSINLVWSSSCVLQESSDHTKGWVDVGKRPSVMELGVELSLEASSNHAKLMVKTVSRSQTNFILYDSDVINMSRNNLWENNHIFQLGVCKNLIVEFKDNSCFIVGSIVGNNNLQLSDLVVFFSSVDDSINFVEGDWLVHSLDVVKS